MPLAALRAYLERLDARVAELQLVMAAAALLPYHQQSEIRQQLDEWQRRAFGRVRAVQPPPRGALALHGLKIVDVPMTRKN